jgi:hypothetical protein
VEHDLRPRRDRPFRRDKHPALAEVEARPASRGIRVRALNVELDRNPDVRSPFGTMHPTTNAGCLDRLFEGHSMGDFSPEDPPNTLVRPDDVPAYGFLATDLDQYWNSEWKRFIQQDGESTHTDIERLTVKLPLVALAGHQRGTSDGEVRDEAGPPPDFRRVSHSFPHE